MGGVGVYAPILVMCAIVRISMHIYEYLCCILYYISSFVSIIIMALQLNRSVGWNCGGYLFQMPCQSLWVENGKNSTNLNYLISVEIVLNE